MHRSIADSPIEVVRPVIEQANANWIRALIAGDADAMAEMFTEDAVFMRVGQSDLKGRREIREEFARDFAARADVVLGAKAEIRTLDVAGDRAWETGTFAIASRPKTDAQAAATTQYLKYISFWRRDADGVWRAYLDIGVPDVPPAPA